MVNGKRKKEKGKKYNDGCCINTRKLEEEESKLSLFRSTNFQKKYILKLVYRKRQ